MMRTICVLIKRFYQTNPQSPGSILFAMHMRATGTDFASGEAVAPKAGNQLDP